MNQPIRWLSEQLQMKSSAFLVGIAPLLVILLSGCAIQPLGNVEMGTLSTVEQEDTDAAADATETPTAEEESDAPSSVFSAATLDELLAVQEGRLGYNGEIQPVRRVAAVAQVGGMVLEVMVDVGDTVEAGDVIARIDSATLEAQRAQAMAGMEAAQAQLDLLNEDPDEEDLIAAQASVNAAEASYQKARQGPTAEDLALAETQVRQADASRRQAQAAYNQVRGNPQVGALPQSAQLEQATLAFEAAQLQLQKLQLGSTADVIAGAYAQLQQAKAQLQSLQEGPTEAALRSAEAQVAQAETSLYLAQLQLDRAEVKAPIDGIVSTVNVTESEMAGSGDAVVELLSPDVEVVIPVEEFRLSQLMTGQIAVIRVDAYPDQLFEGVVQLIAPELDPVTRTVAVTIQPTADAAGLLRPGMFATVDLLTIEE